MRCALSAFDDLTLAFDTSAAHCAAALLSGGTLLAAREEEMSKGQAVRLMPLIEEVLASAQARAKDLTRIGVGIGPGNFTGIRISVSAARGLALALGVPAVGVSTFEALVFEQERPIWAMVDGRRGQVFCQEFQADGLHEPKALSLDAARGKLGDGARVVGRDVDALAEALAFTPLAPKAPLAVAIAQLAAGRSNPDARPAPLYIRAADAAPSRAVAPTILST